MIDLNLAFSFLFLYNLYLFRLSFRVSRAKKGLTFILRDPVHAIDVQNGWEYIDKETAENSSVDDDYLRD
jgi:hypothetical protein